MYRSRRSPLGVALMVGFGVLLGAAIFGEGVAASILAVPFVIAGFLFKVLFFMLLFGFLMKAFRGGGHVRYSRDRERGGDFDQWRNHYRQGQWKARPDTDEKPEGRADRFEEWHRMAHARQEVDDYSPPVEE